MVPTTFYTCAYLYKLNEQCDGIKNDVCLGNESPCPKIFQCSQSKCPQLNSLMNWTIWWLSALWKMHLLSKS